MKDYDNFIDGQFLASTGERIEVRNPSTGDGLCTVPDSTAADLDAAFAAAKAAQPAWAATPAIERAAALREVAAAIRGEAESLARGIVEEQGKTIELAQVEVGFTADYIDYMSEWARRIEGEILHQRPS